MKKILSVILSLLLTISLFSPAAIAADGKVEIAFCVGDSTLTVNGNPVTVETPYVVGAGVTLVPVRIITEAFGAKVGWIAETKTITLDYPDVNIVLQIGNPTAEINGMAQPLLSAPELTKNGFTMVPLRFISENFGATVTYDEETKRITVTKEASSGGTTVEGAIDSKYVGDSYYGWRMENPTDFVMDTRDFDGTCTSWMFDDNNWIEISVYSLGEEYDFDKEFSTWKEYVSKLTLVKADKDTSNPAKKMFHLQAKDKTDFYDIYEIATENYSFVVFGAFENDKAELLDKGKRILSTFDAKYSSEETYDLSNVKDGVRRFKNDTMKFAIDVPQDFVMVSDEDVENAVEFISSASKNNSGIIAEIYSKDSVGGAEALAKLDYDNNKRTLNEELVKFDSQISQKSYKTVSGYEYSYDVNITGRQEYSRDFFFEVGDYVYNVRVTVQLPSNNKTGAVEAILNSIEAQPLDKNVIGTIMRNDPDSGESYICDALNRCSMKIPGKYEEISATKTAVSYGSGGVIFTGTVNVGEDITFKDVRSFLQQYEKQQSKMENVEVVKSVSTINAGKRSYVKLVLKLKEGSEVAYQEIYMTSFDGMLYGFEALYMEIAYSEQARSEIAGILESIEYK